MMLMNFFKLSAMQVAFIVSSSMNCVARFSVRM